MEGPHDPQHPGQDAGASEPEAQDSDLHALLERLLGQGDVRPSAPGAGDELWPDLAAAPAADEVSTIVPAPDAPAAVAELPTAVEETVAEAGAEAGVELATAREWEPVVVDAAAMTTNVDDIHAAILARVSVDLEPVASEAQPEPELDLSRYLVIEPEPPAAVDSDPPSLDDLLEAALPIEALAVDPPIQHLAAETTHDDVTESVEPAAAVVEETAAAAFTLTPFEALEADAAAEPHADTEALWDAALPELGQDVAPLLDLDGADDDEPAATTAVVLPWPSHEPKAAEPAAPTAQDLIEAALSGLSADLTSEPVEPLRTPDVAVSTAHVVFHLGSRTMAIPLAAVSEIARPPKVTRLPHVPAWVLGIANLRGDIVSMLDLEGFLSGKVGKSGHEQRMLALRPAGDEVRTAVLVDSVDGIQAFEDARISRVTRGYDAAVAPYARGLYQVEDDLVVVLDAERLLQSKPMRQFEDGAGAR
jgi:twitching motility protein PilI